MTGRWPGDLERRARRRIVGCGCSAASGLQRPGGARCKLEAVQLRILEAVLNARPTANESAPTWPHRHKRSPPNKPHGIEAPWDLLSVAHPTEAKAERHRPERHLKIPGEPGTIRFTDGVGVAPAGSRAWIRL